MEFCNNKKTLRLLASGFACFDKIENRPSRPPVCANNHDADDVGGNGQIDQRCKHVRLGKFNNCGNKARIAGGGGRVKLSRVNHAFNAWRIIIFGGDVVIFASAIRCIECANLEKLARCVSKICVMPAQIFVRR